jgi:hypothetical protein
MSQRVGCVTKGRLDILESQARIRAQWSVLPITSIWTIQLRPATPKPQPSEQHTEQH